MSFLRRYVWLTFPFIVAAISFFVGIDWGLPTRDVDRHLFGDRTPWTGEEILALAGDAFGSEATTQRASDHDANPLANRDTTQVINETDEQRAEIVLRYRLYSQQPDEMLTPRALAQMKPGQLQLDPKMYQYGGLWVYPVGGLLKALSIFDIVTLKSDRAFYLDHPEEFGKFYAVMRAYSAMWGLLGVAATMLIVRRLVANDTIAVMTAGVVFALLPVVVNMAHEAKPHLAGAVLMLWTILFASRYVRTGGLQAAVLTGATWGAATGMVLLSLPGVVVLATMVLLRRKRRDGKAIRDGLIALLAGVIVYSVTNPYVLINAIVGSGGTVTSNMTAHGNFYWVHNVWNGFITGIDLIAEGSTLVVAVIGIVSLIVFAMRWRKSAMVFNPDAVALTTLLLVPSLVVTLQFVLLGAGKPGEYARFALLPCIALAIAAVVGVRRLIHHRLARISATIGLWIVVSVAGGMYGLNFARAAGWFGLEDTRNQAANTLSILSDQGKRSLAIIAEPAPYSVPPVDLFRWRLHLLPISAANATTAAEERADVYVAASDRFNAPPAGYVSWSPSAGAKPWPTPISWSNKPIDLFVPQERSVREGWAE